MTTALVLAIILAVALDHYARRYPGGKVLQSARSTGWLNVYLAKCISFLEKIGIKQNFVIILSVILPIAIGLFIVKLLLGLVLGERIALFVFTTLVLFYYLGNNDVEDQPTPVVLAHETSFGVFFWYAVFSLFSGAGFIGALLYWFFVAAKQTNVMLDPINSGLRQALVMVHAVAAWLPARATGFIYALMGNFDPGFKAWLNCAKDAKMPSSQVLQECGQASLAANSSDEELRLVNRTYFAWVVLVIVVVML